MAAAEVGALGGNDNKSEPPAGEDGSMTLWEHLEELRGRIVRMMVAALAGGIGCWIFKERILAWLTLPFYNAWKEAGLKGAPALNSSSPAALFLGYVHISALAGFLVALPIILYQLWAFVAPGLYSREKRFAIPFVVSSCALFVGGGYFGWAVAFPAAFTFLLSFNHELLNGLLLQPAVMIGEYLDFCTRLFLAFGTVAELPVLAMFLTVAGLITHRHLIKFFRYFIVVAFIIAAVVTPPDPLSQFLLAVPLIGLYGVSIVIAWAITRSKERAAAKADAS
ncbi:MAG TPA: twin-arginine translocase subunit TatC [Polyangiaceae bacterium]